MLPEKFKARMKRLLKDEYEAFENALVNETAKKGFRINTLKCSPEDFIRECSLESTPLSYVKNGFILTGETRGIGNTPAHHAGQIYIQDPGAMASVAALEVHEGDWIADLCAAPGGKSTQLAAELGEGGFILSNEYVPKRAKILVSNFERMGIRRGIVTSLDTAEIARLYDSVFDIVVADAPCSGEGMFRKDVPAIEEWSEENVSACKARQSEILENAAKILKAGGRLLYSTCTYSPEENEEVVDEFLKRHEDFALCDVPEALASVTSDGIQFDGAHSMELKKCRRFYPHKAEGEGQFIALMTKKTGNGGEILYKDNAKQPSRDEMKIIEDFFRDNLISRPDGKVMKHGENLVLISHGCPIPPKSVFSAGVLIGEIRGKNLFPSHQFFSAYGTLFKRKQKLDEKSAERYLAGEEIDATDFSDSGLCSLIYGGSALGGGKASGGKIKNHYPKGLRVR